MYIYLKDHHENRAWHVRWCKQKNCPKCKEYVEYIQEHEPGKYDNWLKDGMNWERYKKETA